MEYDLEIIYLEGWFGGPEKWKPDAI